MYNQPTIPHYLKETNKAALGLFLGSLILNLVIFVGSLIEVSNSKYILSLTKTPSTNETIDTNVMGIVAGGSSVSIAASLFFVIVAWGEIDERDIRLRNSYQEMELCSREMWTAFGAHYNYYTVYSGQNPIGYGLLGLFVSVKQFILLFALGLISNILDITTLLALGSIGFLIYIIDRALDIKKASLLLIRYFVILFCLGITGAIIFSSPTYAPSYVELRKATLGIVYSIYGLILFIFPLLKWMSVTKIVQYERVLSKFDDYSSRFLSKMRAKHGGNISSNQFQIELNTYNAEHPNEHVLSDYVIFSEEKIRQMLSEAYFYNCFRTPNKFLARMFPGCCGRLNMLTDVQELLSRRYFAKKIYKTKVKNGNNNVSIKEQNYYRSRMIENYDPEAENLPDNQAEIDLKTQLDYYERDLLVKSHLTIFIYDAVIEFIFGLISLFLFIVLLIVT